MVKSVGFDPLQQTKRMQLLQFILWSWKDAVFKIFYFKGRTSRAAFLVFTIPLLAVWLGVASWFKVTDMDTTSDIFNKLVELRFAFGVLTLLFLPSLIFRRLHDGANKVVNVFPFRIIDPFGLMIFLYRILFDFDVDTNKHGRPNTIIHRSDHIS